MSQEFPSESRQKARVSVVPKNYGILSGITQGFAPTDKSPADDYLSAGLPGFTGTNSNQAEVSNLLHRRLPLHSLDQPDHVKTIRLVHIRLAAGDGLVVACSQSPAPLSLAGAGGASGLPVNLEIHSVRSMRFRCAPAGVAHRRKPSADGFFGYRTFVSNRWRIFPRVAD